jgi:two-component system, chemotaxis family, chemotaxis protein CheY
MGPTRIICVADDDVGMRRMICQMLSQKGYQTIEASDGKEALRQVADAGARMIVLDIIMPNSEGLETIPELKERFPATCILAISGGGDAGDGRNFLEQASLLGADDTLLKPFEMDALIAKVEALAGRPEDQRSTT